MKTFWLASFTLWQRELVRFFRQPSRVIGAFAPPVLFWFLIGSGLGKSFMISPELRGTGTPEQTYLHYFFPGTIALIVLFTAVFSTISVIEDRHEGFLQSVLVAPLSRVTLVLGKVLGGATLAMIQAVVFLFLAPLAGLTLPAASWIYVLAILGLMSIGLTGLGFILAWKMDSTQGFHSVMNLFLIPMWLLSGSLFPASGASPWVALLIRWNPLSYGVFALQQHLLVHGQPLATLGVSDLACFVISLAFAAVMFGASVAIVRPRQ
jgi:ABC-2 type transport system permease protein